MCIPPPPVAVAEGVELLYDPNMTGMRGTLSFGKLCGTLPLLVILK